MRQSQRQCAPQTRSLPRLTRAAPMRESPRPSDRLLATCYPRHGELPAPFTAPARQSLPVHMRLPAPFTAPARQSPPAPVALPAPPGPSSSSRVPARLSDSPCPRERRPQGEDPGPRADISSPQFGGQHAHAPCRAPRAHASTPRRSTPGLTASAPGDRRGILRHARPIATFRFRGNRAIWRRLTVIASCRHMCRRPTSPRAQAHAARLGSNLGMPNPTSRTHSRSPRHFAACQIGCYIAFSELSLAQSTSRAPSVALPLALLAPLVGARRGPSRWLPSCPCRRVSRSCSRLPSPPPPTRVAVLAPCRGAGSPTGGRFGVPHWGLGGEV